MKPFGDELFKLRKINRYFLDDASKHLTDALNALDDFVLRKSTRGRVTQLMSQASPIQNRNSHKESKPPWNNHFTIFRSEDMMKRDPNRCICADVPIKTRIKKLLVSDKRYNSNPNDEEKANKEPKHPYVKKCYCLDDMNLAEHSNERFDDAKTPNNFSRKADKQEDDYPREYPRRDVIDHLVSHDQPRSRDFNSMTSKDIETLRKFRDKHYFECHSIEARIPRHRDKQKNIHKYEVNQRMFPEGICNNFNKCHCYCTLSIGDRNHKIKRKPPKIHQSIPITESEEINSDAPRTNGKDTENNNRKDVYFCCPNCPCHKKQRAHSQDNYNSRNRSDIGNSRHNEAPDNYTSKRRQSQENYTSRRPRSPENYTSKKNHDHREHSDDAEKIPRRRTRDNSNHRHSQPKNYHDYTEFSGDEAERRTRRRTSENNAPRDSKTNGRDNMVNSEVPKYILKIPEVYIKFPITESMIVTEKRAEKNGKNCKCPCVKEYERRKSAPVNDSLALRHQQGYRRTD